MGGSIPGQMRETKGNELIEPSVMSFFHSLVAVAVLAGMSASASAQADAEDAYTEFSDAYAAYTSAIEAGDQVSALPAASAAYELGVAQFVVDLRFGCIGTSHLAQCGRADAQRLRKDRNRAQGFLRPAQCRFVVSLTIEREGQ